MNKLELLKWLKEEQEKWDLIIAAIGETRMAQAGVNGDWSMRDIVAHLTGWQRWLVIRLQAAAEAQSAPSSPWPAELTSDDEINAWIYESNRRRTVRQLLDDADDVHAQLLATLQSLPEESRIETIEAKFPVIWVSDQRFAVGEFFHHFYDDHMPDVRAWLARAEKP